MVNLRALTAGVCETLMTERGPHDAQLEDEHTPTIAPPLTLNGLARRSKGDESDDEDQKDPAETPCWVMFGGFPSSARLPQELIVLINSAVGGPPRGHVD